MIEVANERSMSVPCRLPQWPVRVIVVVSEADVLGS
jgi:hypothetical protein